MKATFVSLGLMVLVGCATPPTPVQVELMCNCPPYAMVKLASTLGEVSGASLFLATAEDALPGSQCDVARSMYDRLKQPYSDMPR